MKLGFSLLIVLLSVSACQTKNKPKSVDPSSAWAGKMQDMAVEVRELIPFLYNPKAFQDPVNAARIKADLQKFAAKAHEITPAMGESYFGQDPMESYSLEGMRADLSRAADAFDQGRLEFARGAAKAATTHCFRCHSVTKEGSRAAWDLSKFSNLELAPTEKVDLIVAIRRYDEAAKYLETLISDDKYVQNYPFEFENLLRKYMSLMIRVENSPERPLRELDRVLKIKNVPVYVLEQARAWRTSLQEWKQDVGRKNVRKIKNDLLQQAGDRVRRGTQQQQFAKDHAGDIEFLRATRMLHDYLRTQPPVSKRAEAYLLLGQAYEVLDELGYWNLHEVYYESCIKAAPKTAVATKCFGRFEASIYLGFSGSSGVHIPAQERERLKQLKEMTL
ncbi:MAG: hypothetical protein AB7N80_13785 [Bdellovibrionales bacterium]